MSSPNDIEDARRLFIAAVDMDHDAASRIADLVARVYALPALTRPRDVVMQAALWAASQLNALPPTERAQVDATWIRALMRRSDCPLCMNEGDGGTRGSTSRSPVGVPA